MSNTIICPNCDAKIETTEVMRSQLATQIRTDLEAETSKKRREVDDAQERLDQDRAAVEEKLKSIEDEIGVRVESKREELLSEAKARASESHAIEIKDREERLAELEEFLKTSQANELELRRRERELQSKTEGLELEVARKLDAERETIRAEALIQSDEQHRLNDAQKEKQIVDLRKQIGELKRKAEVGSQQLQGEVQELALEGLLDASFLTDVIESVAKGVRGADLLQTVLDKAGLNCGQILWESKRTKNWSNSWLAKARDDQRAARASCVVIVSETLPENVRTFSLVDNVWVCSWSCVIGLAAALRIGLMEVAKSKLAVQGQHEKMEVVYNYLASQDFQQRVSGVVEAFTTMQSDLESEKRSMQRIWSRRSKQLERALNSTAGMYGDLQGIIGASLPEIECLSLHRIELDANSVNCEQTQDEHNADGNTPSVNLSPCSDSSL